MSCCYHFGRRKRRSRQRKRGATAPIGPTGVFGLSTRTTSTLGIILLIIAWFGVHRKLQSYLDVTDRATSRSEEIFLSKSLFYGEEDKTKKNRRIKNNATTDIDNGSHVLETIHRNFQNSSNDKPTKNDTVTFSPDLKWTETWEWLCPRGYPNLSAVPATYQLAQNVFYFDEIRNITILPTDKKRGLNPYVRHNDTDWYFSHWPGHVSYTEKGTNRTAIFMRTWKCGNHYLNYYFEKIKKEMGGIYNTSLVVVEFPTEIKNPACIVSAYRDPISHFLSGLGEFEARTRRRRKSPAYSRRQRVERFESFPLPSEERFISFVELLLRFDWVKKHGDYRHVFPQSGYRSRLHALNRSITRLIPLHDLPQQAEHALRTTCGMSQIITAPTQKKEHTKIEGLEDFLKGLWKNVSENTGRVSGKLRRTFEAICLLDAVDYACLASALNPPSFCARVYDEHLLPLVLKEKKELGREVI